jgi:hypothetical protein
LLLHKQKHQAGFPFMIDDSEELSSNQVYMEYADGRIEIVEFTVDYTEYYTVRQLNQTEVLKVREKYHLNYV